VDTMELRSDAHLPYKPVASSSPSPGLAGERSERSGFHSYRSRRFGLSRVPLLTFAGVDNVDGESQWRVDFLAADRSRVADVAGVRGWIRPPMCCGG